MSNLKICRICLRTEAKGYTFQQFHLKSYYEEVIALKVNGDGLPQWFCYECAMLLYKFHKFKEKCYIGQKTLKEMLWKGPITYEAIYKIDHSTTLQTLLLESTAFIEKPRSCQRSLGNLKTLTPPLTLHQINNMKTDEPNNIKAENVNLTDKENSINVVYVIDKNSHEMDENSHEIGISSHEINDNSHELISNNHEIDENSHRIDENHHEIDENIHEIDENSHKTDDTNKTKETESYSDIYGDDIVKIEDIDQELSEKESNTKDFGNNLSENNWKIIHLTEEEALKEFRAKAMDSKYLNSAFKCGDCFKGFSKKDMLERHIRSRHSEELGSHECRVCRARFKWRCHLRKHIQQHYTRFQCVRCDIVLHLDTSALLHEEYHSGITKKCAHCNEEFRHMTTYYTHLRTHRSGHVCSVCGGSYVSVAGLRQHRQRTHYNVQDSSADEDTSSTYCDTCEITFDSRKAYEQHLFHSDMHAHLIKTEKEDDVKPTKKILGKRLREQITKELRKGVFDVDTNPVKSKRRKKIKKKQRIPSTCHQCGEQFSTQAACMKHHTTHHPRTSFYPPAQRHICELCGASLAPGSVAVHKNMHSREKLYTCDTCGRQFHSTIGLKRHFLTHTGEKPYGCPLCDKKFTQSNSMKLHYRTFHLKQPYPKRNRKKKKEEQNHKEKEDSYDSDSLPEMEPEAAPVPEAPLAGHVIVVRNENDENVHYLTLS